MNTLMRKVSLLLAVCLLQFGASAQADAPAAKTAVLPKYQQECAACHIAYPPGMLPAGSWQRLMGSLRGHFGTDASLDAASVREIDKWLQIHAGTYKRVGDEPTQDRITQSTWFLRKHNAREVPPALWKRPGVGGAANCAACHARAGEGSFSEREIKIPN